VSFGYSQTVLEDFEALDAAAFAGFEGLGGANIVANPSVDANNMSATAGELIVVAAGQPWQGANLIMQSNYVDISDPATMPVEVLAYSTTPFNMLARTADGQAGAVDSAADAAHGGTGWETLTFTFNEALDGTAPANGEYGIIAFFPNWNGTGWYDPEIEITVYIDDVAGTVGSAIGVDTCSNGVMDGDETGVDCGGSCPNACPPAGPSIINVDANDTWSGFANVFELPENGGALVFGQGWGVPDLKTEIDLTGNSLTLKPNFNTWDPADAFWTTNTGGVITANKTFEASTFVENNALAGADLTFYGSIGAFDMPAGYTVDVFIKGLDPNAGFADVVGVSAPLTAAGEFSVSATAAQLVPGLVIQYGFRVFGPIADPATENARQLAIGGVQVVPSTLTTSDFEFFKLKRWIIFSKNKH